MDKLFLAFIQVPVIFSNIRGILSWIHRLFSFYCQFCNSLGILSFAKCSNSLFSYFKIYECMYTPIKSIKTICFCFFEGVPCGVMVKAMDCRIVISEFELQLYYCIHFWTNTLGKGMNLLILHYGLNSATAVLLKGWLWHSLQRLICH